MQSVCVFCGSSTGTRPEYLRAAERLGTVLAERHLRLVYGGSSLGMMTALADAALAGSGNVIGVMPQALVEREQAHLGLTELRVVDTMHERKATMTNLADAFIALPGGVGTLEELFEVWSWSYLGLHRKPFGLLDVNGYWSDLIRFLDHSVREGFVRPEVREMIVLDEDPGALLDRLSGRSGS